MAAAGRELRLSVQTKVLIPALAFLVLVPAIMVWIVNRQIRGQVLVEAQQALSTADGVFGQSLKIRSRDLVLRFRNRPTDSHFVAYAQDISAGLATEKTLNTVQGILRDWLDEFGDDCDAVLLVPAAPALPIGAHHESAFRLDDFARAAKGLAAEALKGESQTGVVSLNGAAFDVVSVPVLLPDNTQPIGAFIVALRIGDSAMQQLKTLTHTEILLVAGGKPILSTRPEIDQAVLRQIPAPAAAGGSLEAAEPRPVEVNGEHFLALAGPYGPVGSPGGVGYVMLSSYEQSLLNLEATQRMLVAVSLAGFLLSAAVVWFCVRRVIRPLSELRDTAEAVGRGDFSRRIARFSNDECGDLADAFNRMTTNLQSSRAELEKAVETLKNTQAQLIQSEKLSAVGQFVAGVAHELNNPLTAVIGFSDLLSKTGTDEAIRPHLELIAKSAQRCHKIVQNLLSFARQHPPERALTQVNGTIDEVLEIMAYDLRTSNIAVVREFQDDLPTIMADSYQLQQVFVNIVGNARQAIQTFRPDGKIVVRTRVEGASVRIEFADNGPGIRPENLSRIFDPFFTTKAVGKGTGLGLSLTYGIIQEHRGRISAQSELGRGATFVIELPAAAGGGGRPQKKNDGASARLAPPAGPSGKSVLVVDDEEWILELARELIARGGHTVEAVSGAEKAIEALRRRKFDIVVCDWKMPGMSGIQFYEQLLATDPAMAGRVLFMSGDVINDSFQEFLGRHQKTCLAKPFAIEDFQGAVESVLVS